MRHRVQKSPKSICVSYSISLKDIKSDLINLVPTVEHKDIITLNIRVKIQKAIFENFYSQKYLPYNLNNYRRNLNYFIVSGEFQYLTSVFFNQLFSISARELRVLRYLNLSQRFLFQRVRFRYSAIAFRTCRRFYEGRILNLFPSAGRY
jgi:hypothetical protein